MVNSCIAVGCTNHAQPGSGISFHAFPHKNSELLQKMDSSCEQNKLGTKQIQPYLLYYISTLLNLLAGWVVLTLVYLLALLPASLTPGEVSSPFSTAPLSLRCSWVYQ